MSNQVFYTQQEADALLEQLRKPFSVVRILKEPEVAGLRKIHGQNCSCFEFWGKKKACDNCISYKTLYDHEGRIKFEYLDGKTYQVISKYINVDNEKCVLEILQELSKVTLDLQDIGALSNNLSNFNETLYREPLTKVYNRAYYEDHKDTALLNAGVVFIDVDDFKCVNDTYGHLFGDEVLKTVAYVFLQNVRKDDVVIRYGGDEFVMLLNNIEPDILSSRLDKLQQDIRELRFPTNPDYHVTVSIGATIAKQKTLEEAIAIADKQMFLAKKNKDSIVKDW